MRVLQLDVQSFRCYEYARLSFASGVNAIVGPNAAGKTALLEALILFGQGRSPRTRSDKDLIAFAAQEARLRVQVTRADREVDLAMRITQSGKQITINRKPSKSVSDFLGNLLLITFSPQDLRLVQGGPEERRRFLNLALSPLQPAYLKALQTYMAVLARRNQSLRQGQRAALDVWDEQLALPGGAITAARKQFVARLSTAAAASYQMVAGSQESLRVVYAGEVSDVATEQMDLRRALAASREADLRLRFTSVGPHRDDLRLLLAERPAARFASQGQQRSIALALKFALLAVVASDTGESPIVLLDDVLSELDEARQENLFAQLGGLQCIFTATSGQTLPAIRIDQVFRVARGIILE